MIYEDPIKRIIYLIINDEVLKDRHKTFRYIGRLLDFDKKTIKKYYNEYKFLSDIHDIKALHTNMERIDILEIQLYDLLRNMTNWGEIDTNLNFSLSLDLVYLVDKIRRGLKKSKEDCIKY